MKKSFVGFITALAMIIMALPIRQVKAAEMKTVTVSNAEELLAAIASDTKIMLKPGEYKITEETITTDWGSYKEERNVCKCNSR